MFRTQFKLLTLFFLSFGFTTLFGQVSPQWATTYVGNYPMSYEQMDMVTDDLGNVYVTGRFFDTSWANVGSMTIKYNGGGGLEWVTTHDSLNWFTRMAIDNSSNIYVTGMTIYNGDSLALLKYDSDGVLQWKRLFGTALYWNWGWDVITDDSNNVYVTGSNLHKIVTLKYDSNGNLLWNAIDSCLNGVGRGSIGLDNDENVYVTGTGGGDTTQYCHTFKYDQNGSKQWEQHYFGTFDPGVAYGRDIKIDSMANIYVLCQSVILGGGQGGATVVKYDSSGNFKWEYYIANAAANEYGNNGIDVDPSGNVYVVSTLYNNCDDSIKTVKIDSIGNLIWQKQYSLGYCAGDIGCAVIIGEDGYINVAGYSSDANNKENYVLIKYDPLGNEQAFARYHHATFSRDYCNSMALDNQGNIFLSGTSIDLNSWSFLTLKYSNQIGIEELNEYSTLVYPNPFTTNFIIQTEQLLNDATLTLFDMTGKQVRAIPNINSNSIQVDRNNLSSGMYFYTLTENSETIKTGKIVAE